MQKCVFLEFEFWGQIGRKNQNCQFNLNFRTKRKSNIQNSIYVTFFCFRIEIPILEKLFKVKSGTLSQNNLNMQNSLVIFFFFIF